MCERRVYTWSLWFSCELYLSFDGWHVCVVERKGGEGRYNCVSFCRLLFFIPLHPLK